MVTSMKWRVIFVGVVVTACLAGSFLVGGLLVNKTTASEGNDNVQFVSTVEEASRIAGYQVVKPAFLPKGLNNHSISVSEPVGDGGLPKRVIQLWSYDGKSPAIMFVQDPELDGIGGGEPAKFSGITGMRNLSPATADRPANLLFYWQDGDMAYVITSNLTAPINEEVLENIVLSIGGSSQTS